MSQTRFKELCVKCCMPEFSLILLSQEGLSCVMGSIADSRGPGDLLSVMQRQN